MNKFPQVFAAPYRVGNDILTGIFTQGAERPIIFSDNAKYIDTVITAFNDEAAGFYLKAGLATTVPQGNA